MWGTHGVARAASVITATEQNYITGVLYQSGKCNARNTAWNRGSLRKGS